MRVFERTSSVMLLGFLFRIARKPEIIRGRRAVTSRSDRKAIEHRKPLKMEKKTSCLLYIYRISRNKSRFNKASTA